jgi:hypothetical protein
MVSDDLFARIPKHVRNVSIARGNVTIGSSDENAMRRIVEEGAKKAVVNGKMRQDAFVTSPKVCYGGDFLQTSHNVP